MPRLRAGLLVALLAGSAACLAAPESHLVAKSLASRGDRFIQLQHSGAGNRYVNIAADLTVLYTHGAIEVRPRGANAALLRYEFASANPSVPQGLDDSGITYNFFVGSREHWVTGLKSYSQVAYRGPWTGIDATYSGDSGGIKYHFDVAPGADARKIAFLVRGAESARIAEDGAVEWSVGGKRLRDERPVAYQAGASGDAIVPAAFTLEAAGPGAWRLGFEVGAYDRARALTLDPAWTAFSGLVGGNAADQVYGVARDSSGNSYACGVTASTDLPPLSSYDPSSNGGDDAFLVKFNVSGVPQFVTYFGGSGFDVCTGIALNASDGTIYVAGGTTSPNFPFAGAGDAWFRRAKAAPDRDAFVAKFGATGNTLSFSGVIGGTSDDQAMAIALDSGARAYVTGYSSGTSFPLVTGPGSFAACSMCVFVTRINAAGTITEYSGSLLGDGTIQVGRGIAAVSDNSAYVVGETNSTSGLTGTAGTFRTVPGGGEGDGFVAKVSFAGGLVYYTLLTGTMTGAQTGVDRALGIAIDTSGTNLWIVGETDSGNFPANDAGTQLGTGSGLQNTPSANMDGFVVRINANASLVQTRSYVGSARFDTVEGVALVFAGGVYVAGTTSNTNSAGGGANGFPFAATPGLATTNLGQQDGFVARVLSTSGTAFSGFVGSSGNDAMHAIAATTNSVLSLGGATTVSAGLRNTNTGALSAGASATNGLVLRVNALDPYNLSVISGVMQSANVFAAFGFPLRVRVTLSDGTGFGGVSVTFTPPPSGASAVLSAGTVFTDATGYAEVTATANANGGGYYNVIAEVSGLSPVLFSLNNNFLSQAISFAALSDRPTADPPFTVSASGGASGNPVIFTSQTAATCTTSGTNGTTVTLTGAAGPCTIAANQAGNASYSAAPQEARTFNVIAPAEIRPRDLSGEGRSDILLRGPSGEIVAWLMDGSAISSATLMLGGGSGFQAEHFGDFNGDGRKDILLSGAAGELVQWTMNGSAIAVSNLLLSGGSGYVVDRIGDFDGDGKDDILFKGSAGDLVVWIMNGATVSTSATVLGAGTGFAPVVIGDFNNDGKDDIVIAHADGRITMWLMNGTTIASSVNLLGAGTGYTVSHAGDFNNDQKDDLVLKGPAGEIVIWQMDGTTIESSALLYGGGSWQVSHIGDVNGDGFDDIAMKGPAGEIVVWVMNGAAITSSTLLFGGGSWQVTQVGDYNADGKSDLLLKGPGGEIVVWIMNGPTIASATLLVGATTWVATP